jgi:hypothetical protein
VPFCPKGQNERLASHYVINSIRSVTTGRLGEAMTARRRMLVVAVAAMIAGLVAGLMSVTSASAATGAGSPRQAAPYVPGTDGHLPNHPGGIKPNQAGDPTGSHFGQYDPGAWGWQWAGGSIPFSFQGHSFPQGVANADIATIDTKILSIIVPRMRERLCYQGDCWGYEVRNIAGSSSHSFHGYGLAIDVNAATNGQTTAPMSTSTTTLPLNTGALIRPYGAEWGGDWSSDSPRDPMHIEIHLSPAGAAGVAANIRAGGPLKGPAYAHFGSTVTLTGAATANTNTTVWLHRRGKDGYVAHTVAVNSFGVWSLRYLASDDYRYHVTTSGHLHEGLTQIDTTLSGPAHAARNSRVTITGTGRPSTTLNLRFHKQNTVGYTAGRTVQVTGNGLWSSSYVATDDYRYYTTDNTTGKPSNFGLTQVG